MDENTGFHSKSALSYSKQRCSAADPAEKEKLTEKTDFLLTMCQGTWSRLNPCRKAIERLCSYFDRAEIEPGGHYFNTKGNQTDQHQSHSGKVSRLMTWSQVTSWSHNKRSILGRLPSDIQIIFAYSRSCRSLLMCILARKRHTLGTQFIFV
jgi:hypothetical protein